ncbi:MAG TPA: hypothetical protein VHQ93_15030, partial [Chitinophagaceae bacterium]|nr:hypothetical protein [Chitinophagaceae bacterium]
MKLYVTAPIIFILAITTNKCKNKNEGSVYKGRLEVKGMCMNYTIKLLDGNIDTSKLVSEWKNEITGKTHNNVFALGSVCNFPPTINEGDEFSFTIDT